MTPGLHGKHPAFGDFIGAGLPDEVQTALGDWLQATLGAWRAAAGDDWQAAFDAAPPVAFWVGAALCGGVAVRGVLRPSRDRSGRRYPLVLAQLGGWSPATDPDQAFHETAAEALDALIRAPSFEPRDVAQRLATSLPEPPAEAAPAWPTFWALNPRRDAGALLAQLAAPDHAHAASCRSYWWFAGDHGAGVLACQSWPGPVELDWLIRGGRTLPEQPQSKETA